MVPGQEVPGQEVPGLKEVEVLGLEPRVWLEMPGQEWLGD